MSEANAAGIGQMLGDAGPCPTIAHGTKVWQVGWPTQRAKAVLEQLVVQVAKANIEDARAVLTDTEYQAERDTLSKAIRGGYYKTRGALWMELNQGPQSISMFLTSMLREKQPDAKMEDAVNLIRDCPRDVIDTMTMVAPDFFRQVLADSPKEEVEALVAVMVQGFKEGAASIASSQNPPT